MNREGKNGYLTLESKRRLKAKAQVSTSHWFNLLSWLSLLSFSSDYPKALKEEAAGEESASPNKIDHKKRGHVKDDPDSEGAAEDEPPTKKSKAKTKKETKIKNEDADGGSENEGPTVMKTTRVKKEPKIKNEDAETRSESEGPANKKAKAEVKKGNKANRNEAKRDLKQDPQPAKRSRKRVMKATSRDESGLHIKDESSDHDAIPPAIAKKTRAPRKAVEAKKIKDEESETDGLDPASELEIPLANAKLEHTSELEAEASEDAPKLQKGRKNAPKKAVNGTAEDIKKEVKPKVRMLVA